MSQLRRTLDVHRGTEPTLSLLAPEKEGVSFCSTLRLSKLRDVRPAGEDDLDEHSGKGLGDHLAFLPTCLLGEVKGKASLPSKHPSFHEIEQFIRACVSGSLCHFLNEAARMA